MTNTTRQMCPSRFDSLSTELDGEADALQSAAVQAKADARKELDHAKNHASAAIAQTAGAAINAVVAVGQTAQGVAQTASSVAHLAAAGTYAAAGVVARDAEAVAAGVRYVTAKASRGFAALANALSHAIGDGDAVTASELPIERGQHFSDRLFAEAGEQVTVSAEELGRAWKSYAGAAEHLAGSAVNVGLAVVHTGAGTFDLAQAATQAQSASVLEMDSHTARAAAAAFRAAEEGERGQFAFQQ